MLAIAPVLLQAVPFLADLFFGDKTGKAVEKAAGIAAEILNVKPGDQDGLQKALANLTPDKAVELKIALAKFAHEEKQAQLAAEQADSQRRHAELMKRIEDVSNARGTMVDLAKVGSKLAWGAAIVSVLVTVLTGVMGYLIFTGKVPAENRDLALLFAGNMLGNFGAVIAFWVGSSAGSVQKTDTSAQLAAIAASAPARK